jgi:RND family efflux transporter MFP subunit
MTTRRVLAAAVGVALAVGLPLGAAGQAESTVVAQGRILFRAGDVVTVHPPVTGRVVTVLARAGQRVAAGAPLAVVSSDLASALADQLRAEADASAAESEYLRQRQLYRVHAETEAEFDAARAARRAARAALRAARENVALLEGRGRRDEPVETVVRSPGAGQVLAVGVRPGEHVRAGPAGGAMFEVGELEEVEVKADVAARELASLSVGNTVTVRGLPAPAHTFAGRIVRISRSVDPVTCTAAVWCEVERPDATLRPGAGATVAIDVPGPWTGRTSPLRE